MQGKSNVPAIIVGNKCDLPDQRMVGSAEGEALASKLGCQYIESSARQDVRLLSSLSSLFYSSHEFFFSLKQINVDKIFMSLAEQIYKEKSIQKKVSKKKSHSSCSIL